jgi:pimeloyl-ACP methyl ester carboxylesterase
MTISLDGRHGSASPIDLREEQCRIQGPRAGEQLFLRHLPPADAADRATTERVLFVHGATFPSALAAAYRLGGESWMDKLSRAGLDVWALDFVGYGESSRYPEMSDTADAHGPLGTAGECAGHVTGALEFIRQHQRVARVSIIAHSWGTLAAGIHATQYGDRIRRLVLFGPIAMRHERDATVPTAAWWHVTEDYQWSRFQAEVPDPEAAVFSRATFDPWVATYLATDPSSSERVPPAVRVPNGPIADIERAWSGALPYDPAYIKVPTLLVRGEWDTVCTAADLSWLERRLSNAPTTAVTLPRGTHVMHLEEGRRELYAAVERFLTMPVQQ